MHDFRAYIFAEATPPPQRGLSAIAELLVLAQIVELIAYPVKCCLSACVCPCVN